MDGDFQRPENLLGSVEDVNTNRLQDDIPVEELPAGQGDPILARNNVVILPAGAEIAELEAQGEDLVIILTNGERIVVPDGAIIVPAIVVDGVTLPAANVAALLIGNEPEPAGGQAQSSGGNFYVDPGNIQAAYNLGDLLPYTELFFPQTEERELLPPFPVPDEPDIGIITPDNPAAVTNATASVNEAGLPARNGEPGGSDFSSNSETTRGTIVFATPDGFDMLTINGVEITEVGQTIEGDHGVMTITSIEPGRIGYSYTLSDNTLDDDRDTFAVVVTETDGSRAEADLVVSIIDDAPTALDDVDVIDAANPGPATGNALTGQGTVDGNRDVLGADDAEITSVSSTAGGDATVGEDGFITIVGDYGTLVIAPDGEYTYTRFDGAPLQAEDVFTYTLTDSDGSFDTADITIVIDDNPATVVTVPVVGDGTVVDEGGLPPRPDGPVGTGEDADGDPTNNSDTSEATTGVITFTSPDGFAELQINGVTVAYVDADGNVVVDSTPIPIGNGTLVINAVDPEAGTITYTYTLNDNTIGQDTSVDFDVTIVDTDGDEGSATVTIDIIDDQPIANPDGVYQVAEDTAIVITDALSNDEFGADDVDITNVDPVSGVEVTAQPTKGTVTYNDDGTFTYTPFPGEEGSDSFEYTITDGDGSFATTKVTVDIADDSVPQVVSVAATVDDDGLAGGNPSSTGGDIDANAGEPGATPSEAVYSGQIAVDFGNDTGTVSFANLDGTTGTVGTEQVAYSWDAATSTLTATGPRGVLFTVSLAADGAFTVTLVDNVLHADGGVETSAPAVVLNYVATDSDGDSSTDGSLAITFNDDAPTARDEGVVQGSENETLFIDALGNDSFGADGVDTGDATKVFVSTQATQGTVTYNTATGQFEYVPNAGAGSNGNTSDSFSYTIIDADGDASTATVSITLQPDSEPTGGAVTAKVDDDGLSGGNPASTTGDLDANAGEPGATPSEAVYSGTLPFGVGNDGPATIAFAASLDGSTATIGQETVTYSLSGNTLTATGPRGVLFTVELTDAQTGAYTVTLVDNVLHADGNNENNVLTDIGFTVSDSEGETAPITLTINFDDDAPTARGDGVVQGSENETLFIDALGNDSFGADGVDTGDASKVFVSTQATQGTVTYNTATGQFEYVPNAGAGSNGNTSDSFSYTIIDADGDASTATVSITLQPDSEPTGGAVTAKVDDDGLSGGNPASTTGDLDANAGEPGATPSEAVYSGTLPFGVGNDGPATIAFAASLDGSTATIGQETVTYSLSGNTLTATGPRGVLFTVELTDAQTGAYTVTLVDNVLHADGNNENNVLTDIGFTVSDSEGETAPITLTINFDDDAPTARGDGVVQGSENETLFIDALGNDSFGADGVDTGDASKVFVSTQATQGTVTYNTATGQFEYVPNAGAGSNGNTSDSFSYTIIDADGDASTATVSITLQPDSEPTGGAVTAKVDDDGLSGGNPASTTGDLDANAGEPGATPSEAVYSGTLPFGVGNDGPATIAFAASLDGSTATIGQETVTYSLSGNTLTATGPRGVLFTVELTDAQTGAYTVTLVDNVLHADGNNENNVLTDIGFTVSDSEGETAPITLTINFDDDAPTATDNSNDVTEGGSVGGNLLTDNDGAGVDAAGADGYAASGAVSAVASTNVPGNAFTVNGAGNLVIVGQYGTLTVDPDSGVYTYDSDANVISADAQDVFTYTILDADGDPSTATLTIDIANVAGKVSDNDVTVYEEGLPGGSESADNSEVDADGQITVTDATGPFTFTLTGANSNGDGQYGTLVLDANTGQYTYTLDTPYTDTVDENGKNVVNNAESFTYEVRDALNNLIGTGTIQVNIVDDVPTATDQALVSVAEDLVGTVGGNLMIDGTPDTEGADGATVTSFTVGGVTTSVPQNGTDGVYSNANGTYRVDMSGNWTFNPSPDLDQSSGPVDAGFAYTLTDTDGDFDTAVQPIQITDGAGPSAGPDITLRVDDENLADGSSPATPVTDSDTISFTEGSDDIVSITFADGATALANLSGGLTWTRTSDTQITGSDANGPVITLTLSVGANNVATVTATLLDNYAAHPGVNVDDLADLGFVAVVATDRDGDEASANVNVGISDDLPEITANAATAGDLTVDETTLGVADTADMSINSGLFTFDYNADGAAGANAVTYTLGVSANGVDSGLNDVATGQDVLLRVNGAGQVEGYTAGSNQVVFTLSVDGAGETTLVQSRAVTHGDDTDPNDPATLASAGLVTLTATITDGDNDTASAKANIGNALTFLDDGPAIDANTTNAGGTVLTTQDADTVGGTDTDQSTANFSGAFVIDSSSYGADGAGSIVWSYDFVLDTNVSGLSSGGDPIFMYKLADGLVVGSTSNTAPADVNDPSVIFSVSVVEDTGVVTLTQYGPIDHDLPGESAPAYDDQFEVLANNILSLRGRATITDRDGDTATERVAIDLGNNIRFADDGPDVTAVNAGTGVDVDETDAGSLAGYPIGDTSAAAVITYTGDFGGDGAAGTNSVSYSLSILDTDSGLQTADGFDITLSQTSPNFIVGSYDDGTGVKPAFLLVIQADGKLLVQQNVPLDHDVDGNTAGAYNDTLNLDGKIAATVTLTDADGDTDSMSTGIGNLVTFYDDGPSVSSNLLVQLDDDALGGNAGGTGDDAIANTMGTLGFDFGGDGAGTIALLDTGAPAGFSYVLNAGVLEVYQGTTHVVDITVNATTGAYTVTQLAPIDHADGGAENNLSFDIAYRVTDNDGDWADGKLSINVDDDTPIANGGTQTGTVDEDGLPGGIEGGANDVPGTETTAEGSLTSFFTAGADTPLTYGFTGNVNIATPLLDSNGDPVTSGGVAVTYTISGNTLTAMAGATQIFELTVDSTTGAWRFELDGPLDHPVTTGEDNLQLQFGSLLQATDADGDKVASTGSLLITVNDDSPVAFDPENGTVVNNDSPATAFDLNYAGAVGADGLGNVVFDITDGTIATDSAGNALSFNGQPIYVYGDGTNVLTAQTAGGDIAYTITLDPDAVPAQDQYIVDLRGTISNGSELSISNLSEAKAGNVDYRAIGADNPTNNAQNIDILFSGRSEDGTRGTINTTSSVGVDNQSTSAGEVVRIDFLNNAESGAATASGFSFDSHQQVLRFEQQIFQTSGNAQTKVTIDVAAVDADDDQDFGFDPTTPEAGESFVDITQVNVYDASAGVEYSFTSSGTQGAISVIFKADGTVQISGLQAGQNAASRDTYEIITDTGFDAVMVSSPAVNGRNTFDLGIFNVTTLNAATDINLQYDVVGTDADGDSVTVADAIDVTLTPAPAAPPIVLDLDGDGVEFLGLDAGVVFDYGGGLVSTAWVGADDGLLARVTDGGLDIVFTDDAEGASTDLEGVALAFDSDADGMLTSADAEWASFAVWRDADSDGVVDAGEVVSLDDMGIVSIGLASDGEGYTAANDDVYVYGEASYATNDNGGGTLADAGFHTAQRESTLRQAEQVVTAAAAGAMLAAFDVAAHSDGLAAAHVRPAFEMQDAAPVRSTGNALHDAHEAAHELAPVETRSVQDMPETRSILGSGDDQAPSADVGHAPAAQAEDAPAFDTASAPADAAPQFAAFDAAPGVDGAMMEALLAVATDAAPKGEGTGEAVGKVVGDALAGSEVDAIVDAHAPAAAADDGAAAFVHADMGVTGVDLAAMMNGDGIAGSVHAGAESMDDLALIAATAA